MSSPSNGAGRGWFDPNREEANRGVPNSDTPTPDDAAPPIAFSRTPTGVSFSVDGLTVDAEDLDRDRYGQKAIVTVRWGNLFCYRDRVNLDDARRRERFFDKRSEERRVGKECRSRW